jgi:hypothetical protein
MWVWVTCPIMSGLYWDHLVGHTKMPWDPNMGEPRKGLNLGLWESCHQKNLGLARTQDH